jgi:hypothetical protein
MRSVAVSTRFTPGSPQPASPTNQILSTLQNIPRQQDRIRARPAIGRALTALFAIGLALLILMPTARSTGAPSPNTRPASQAAARAAGTLVPAGCFRDPTNHTLTCVVLQRLGNRLNPAQTTTYYITAGSSKGAASPAQTLVPAGCFRDPTHHTLTCVVLQRLANRLNPARATTYYATG